MNATGPTVRTTAPPGGWGAPKRTDDPLALASREALGLPTDRPIVMTGHHAEWWHPGLVAKYVAAHHIAQRAGAAWSWILVDHKETDPCALVVPVDDEGVPTTRTLHLAGPPAPGTSAMRRPSVTCRVPEHLRLWGHAERRVHDIAHLMNEHADAPDLLSQWLGAMRASLAEVVPLPGPVRASRLLDTPGGRRLTGAMLDAPGSCAGSYNAAAMRTPEAKLAPLHHGVDPGAVELPLWYLRDDDTLGRVFAGDTGHLERPLAPRALPLTAIARWLLCDLFIHGEGGYRYDRATEAWMRAWRNVDLAPMASVSADLYLPFGVGVPSGAEAHRAEQRARDLMHATRAEKAPFLQRMQHQQRGSAARRRTFTEMHGFLEDRRREHASELDNARMRADTLRRLRDARPTIESRSWATALHDPRAQHRLAQAVRAEIG